MQRHIDRKVMMLALAAGLTFGAGGIAAAYFTSSGTGSGRADVGTTTGAFDVTTGGPATPLLPGDGPRAFDVAITNTSGADAHIGTVYEAVARYGDSGDAATQDGADIPGCLAGWFSVTPSLAVDELVAPGATVHASDGGHPLPTVTLSESATNQDACQGRSVGITFGTAGP
ncbi:MAG TPA: hypothetical protein VND44_06710 [Acidimicrobiales bacterium]|nr:hypothetical protein [Acidimicrobiales bacterium]